MIDSFDRKSREFVSMMESSWMIWIYILPKKNRTKFTSIALSLTIYIKKYYKILLQVQKYYTLYSNLNPNQVLNAPLNSKSVQTEYNVSHHLENVINLNILTVTICPTTWAAIVKITK